MECKIRTVLSTGLFNDTYSLEGTLENDILNFKEKEFNITIDLKNRTMIRECDDYSLKFNLDTESAKYLEVNLKDINASTKVPVRVDLVDIRDNSMKYIYVTLDNNETITYNISWEEK